MSDPCVILCTIDNAAGAEKVARHLVEGGLAACVNIIPGMTSIYRWENNICRDSECLMIIKATDDRFPALERAIRELHPYDVPEILRLPVSGGTEDYLNWVRQSVSDSRP